MNQHFVLYFRSTHFSRRLVKGADFTTGKEAEDFKMRLVPKCVQNEYWVEQVDIDWNLELKKLVGEGR